MSRLRAAVNIIGALFVAFVATTCVVAALACGTPQEPNTFSITGAWSGNTTYGADSIAVPVNFTFDLVDREGEIQGGGLLTFPDTEEYLVEVNGIRDQQAVNLNLLVGGYYAVGARGSVAGETLTLTLLGSGFLGEQIVMERQVAP